MKANVFWSSFSGNWKGTKENGDYQIFYTQKEAEEFAGVKYINDYQKS